MSRKYKHGDEVPIAIIADRLDELSDAVTKGQKAIDREFTMNIPAEMDRDADLVLATAAKMLRQFDIDSDPNESLKDTHANEN